MDWALWQRHRLFAALRWCSSLGSLEVCIHKKSYVYLWYWDYIVISCVSESKPTCFHGAKEREDSSKRGGGACQEEEIQFTACFPYLWKFASATQLGQTSPSIGLFPLFRKGGFSTLKCEMQNIYVMAGESSYWSRCWKSEGYLLYTIFIIAPPSFHLTHYNRCAPLQ